MTSLTDSKKVDVLFKNDYSNWASLTVYIKKKSTEIRICTDFSTGLNDALRNYQYTLPGLEEVLHN